MRLRVYSHLHHPDRGGGASIFTDLSEGLAQRGHDVELFCAYPYYPEWTNKADANLFRRSTTTMNGVRVVRHGMFIPRNAGATSQRALYEASYAASLARSAVRSAEVDVVIAFLPLVSSGIAALADHAHRNGAPLWVNVQDLSGRAASAYAGRLAGALTRVEEAVLRGASLITTIAPQMTSELAHLASNARRVETFPNWLHSSAEASIDRIANDEDASEPRADRRRPVRILYAGNIGKKQGVDRIIELLRTDNRDFEFEVCGTGAGAADVDANFPHDDKRFRRRPFLAEDEFIARLHWADVFCVPELPTAAASFLPSKLLPATASNTPVLALAGDRSPLRNEIQSSDIGDLADWNAAQSLLDVATSLRDRTRSDPTLVQAMQSRAREQSSAAALNAAERFLDQLIGNELAPTNEPHAAREHERPLLKPLLG